MSSVIKPSPHQSRDREDSDGGFADGLLHSTESSRWDLDKDSDTRIKHLESVPKIVSEPEHYVVNNGGYELLDVLQAWEHIGWCEKNTIKYVYRWRMKNGIEDLQKARQYLDRLIETELKRSE